MRSGSQPCLQTGASVQADLLENLRKQAKQMVRWHRERVWTVATTIRELLPRFREFSDREILEADFKLADAQELVARRAGFDSWQTALPSRPEQGGAAPPEPDRSRLVQSIPFVFVRDIPAACAWYEERLARIIHES